MNDLQFKHHLKDLAHGHHHPEEHDWESAGATKPSRATKAARPKKTATRKTSSRKK
jgi:hypothetical protein